jgi:hypothetical protein
VRHINSSMQAFTYILPQHKPNSQNLILGSSNGRQILGNSALFLRHGSRCLIWLWKMKLFALWRAQLRIFCLEAIQHMARVGQLSLRGRRSVYTGSWPLALQCLASLLLSRSLVARERSTPSSGYYSQATYNRRNRQSRAGVLSC